MDNREVSSVWHVESNVGAGDWQPVALGEILSPVSDRVADWGDMDIPVLSMTRHHGLVLQTEKFDKRVASQDISNYLVVTAGDIVCGFPMDEGVVYALKGHARGAVSPAYRVWRLDTDNVDIDFLDLLLKSPPLIEKYRMLSANVVQRRRTISNRDFQALTVPLPPLPEQRRIAHVLSTIQRAIQAQDTVIAAARELKRSLMHRLFTYGPYAEPLPTKETEIGEVPEDWKLVRVGDVAKEVQYGLNERAGQDGTYPVLRMNNLAGGMIDLTELKYVDLDKSMFERYRLRRGDVLFNRTNSYELVGKTAIFDDDGEYVFASYLVRVAADASQLLAPFLNYQMNWETSQRRLRMLATRGVSQSNISAGKLKQFEVVIPAMPEQEAVVNTLSSADAALRAAMQRSHALATLFKSMLHQLMTGQVRV